MTAAATELDNPQWSPDGRWIGFTRYTILCPGCWPKSDGRPQVVLIHPSGQQPRVVESAGMFGSWSPDSRQLAYITTSGVYPTGIAVGSIDGHTRTTLVTSRYAENPQWSPDGKSLAYSDSRSLNAGQHIYTITLAGKSRQELASICCGGTAISWQPN